MAEDEQANIQIDSRIESARIMGGPLISVAGMEEYWQTTPVQPFDYGQKAAFSTSGTPFQGSRYQGPSLYYPPAPPAAVEVAGSSLVDDTIVQNPLGRRTFSTFSDYQAAVADTRSDLANIYAQRGDAPLVGSKQFESDLQANLRTVNLAAEEQAGGFFSRLHGSGASFALGFGALQMGQSFAQNYAQQNSGQYVSPEQRATQDAGLMAGAGGILGTLAGTAIPGVGPIIGGLVGTSLGTIGQSIVGAGNERAQASREGAETLQTSSGQAASSIRELADAISSLGAPVQVVKEAIGSIAGVGPVGAANAGNLGNLGGMALALGQYAGGDYAGTAKQLRDPALFGLSQQFRQNYALDAGGYAALGSAAITGNDPEALLRAERDVQAAGMAADPQYRTDRANQEAAKPSWMATLRALSPITAIENEVIGVRGYLGGRRADAAQRNQPVNPVIGRLNGYAEDYGAANFATVLDQSTVSLAGGAIEEAALRGGSAADIERSSGGFYSSVTAANADEGRREDVLRRMIADPALSGARTVNQRALNESLGRDQERTLSVLQRRHENTLLGFSESDAAFGLGNLRDTLAGVSARDQAAGDTAYYRQMENEARTTPGLSPNERAQREGQGLQGIYSTRMAVFGETLAQNGANIAGAGVGVIQAQSFGGTSDVAGAQTQVLQEFQARIRELTQELQSGTLTVADRINAERELSSARGNEISLRASIGRDESMGNLSLASTGRQTAGVGLDRLLALGGSGGLPTQALLSGDASALAAAHAIVANNPQQEAEKNLTIRQMELQQAQDQTLTQTYSPSVGQRGADLRARTSYQLARTNPFGGPDSNPFTAGAGLIAQDERELSSIRAFDRSTTDPLAHFANQQQEAGLQVEIAGLRRTQTTAAFSALPEMIAGAQGMRGVGSALIAPGAVSALMTPSAGNGSWGGAGGTAAGVNSFATGITREGGNGAELARQQLAVLNRIAQALESRRNGGGETAFDQTAGIKAHLDSTYNTYTRK